jgi:peroxiredoxin
MKPLQIGQTAPEFSLQSVEGEQISLRDLRQSGQHTLLVFLRHLG